MRRRHTANEVTLKGFYINEVAQGFWGEQNEGRKLLALMGLPDDVIPFSIATLIQNHKIYWKDALGNRASIGFKLKDDQIECYGSYLKRRKTLRVFREWGYNENKEKIARLESEAIGDLCMHCIYEILID